MRSTRNEKVAIFGDYDVDGACSAALLAEYLRACGVDYAIHIPDRITEGYGPNVDAIRALKEQGADILVTVDCGTASIEPLAEAKRLGLDPIVLDHHQAPERLPEALAIVNPNRQDDLSGLGHLCAAGVVFLFLVALNRTLRSRGFFQGAARARPDGEPRSRGSGDGGGRGAADWPQPRLRPPGACHHEEPAPGGPRRASRLGGPRRCTGKLASRLSRRSAHQCRRPYRRCRLGLEAAADGGSRPGCADLPPSSTGSTASVRPSRSWRSPRPRRRRCSPSRRRRICPVLVTASAEWHPGVVGPDLRPDEGAVSPPGLRLHPQSRRDRDRLRPIRARRRSRARRARRGRGRARHQGRRPHHGGRRDDPGGRSGAFLDFRHRAAHASR